MMYCPKCNETKPTIFAYCRQCGTELQQVYYGKCLNCGREFSMNTKYCPACGSPFIVNEKKEA